LTKASLDTTLSLSRSILPTSKSREGSKMKIQAAFLGVLLALEATASAQTQMQTYLGRYQIAPLPAHPGDTIDSVVILDSQTGDLWRWLHRLPGNDREWGDIIYLGKVKPGEKPGDIINRAR
jgi:hypothetical protein